MVDRSKVVEVTLPDGATLFVHADLVDGDADGPSDVGLRQALSLSHVTASIRGLAAELHEALRAARPNAMTVEMGFEFAIKGSQVLALVADAGTTASIRVRLEWHDRGDGQAADNDATSAS